MRIAIITLPLHINFGGIMQAYALQTVLVRMGHQVDVLDTYEALRLPIWKMFFSYAKRMMRKYLQGDDLLVFYEKIWNRERQLLAKNTQTFVDKYIHLKAISSLKVLSEQDYQAYVVGSDQVWRYSYTGSKHIKKYFLSFAKDWQVKRIVYAASFGIGHWEYPQKTTIYCALLLNNFDIVSVREDSAVKLCMKYFGIDAIQALDPTLLLDKHDYEQLAISAPKSKGKLMTYILDPSSSISSLVLNVAERMNLVPYETSAATNNRTLSIDQRVQKRVEEWIRGFMDAEYLITDSFHGCAFAIIFNVPFAVLGNEERGQIRFFSLLRLFGLENRMVATVDEILHLPTIDWEEVNRKRSEMKVKSLHLFDIL
uniref:polysaccharide pyruvyl transferase family protein n=1 Tax=uncultured Bacteroides sp. TaxID=162156 RepID=UPI00280A870A|nr:polysaccharide pyruvyl transferase family protein [uncultured Bacteroides sp.]